MSSADNDAQGKDAVPHRLGQRALGGVLWAFSGAGARALVQLLALMALARLLDPSDFGVAAAALMVVRLLGMAVRFGIGPALMRKAGLDDRDVSTAFSFLVLAGALCTALIWLAAPLLGALFRMPSLAEVLPVMAPAVLILGARETAEALLSRNLRFRQIAIINVAAQVVGYGMVGIGFALLGLGIWSLIAAYLAHSTVRLCLCLAIQPHSKRLHIDPARLLAMVRFGGGIVAWRLANAAAAELDTFVVGRWLGAEALGLYNRGRYLASTPATFLGQGVFRVVFPVVAKLQEQRDRLDVACRRSLTVATLATVPASLFMAITAPDLIGLVLGAQWHAAAAPLAILALGLPFRIGAQVGGSIAAASDAAYTAAWLQSVSAGAVLAGALIGQFWGVAGVAAGVVVALLLNYLLVLKLLRDLTSSRSRDFLRTHWPGVATGLVIAGPVWLVHWGLGELGYGSLVVLIACALAGSLTFLSLLRCVPRYVLGRDGLWALDTLLAKVPKRHRSTAGQLLGRRLEGSATQPSAAG